MYKNRLKRNSTAVNAVLKTMADGSIVVTKQCKIHIPARWTERYLATVGADNIVTGVMAIIVEDSIYAVSLICSEFRLRPDRVSLIDVDGVAYQEFTFEPGSTMFESTQLLMQDTLVYYLFDEVITKGNVPWYMDYNDLGKMLDSAERYAGTNLARNRELNELIASLIARDANKRTEYYRSAVTKQSDLTTSPPDYVALSSVVYSATSTLTKMAGSYMSEGMISAIVNPSTKVERIESLLRA